MLQVAYEITISDNNTGNNIAKEYWYAPEFYVNLANSSGVQHNCDEEKVFFLGTGRFVTVTGTVFDEMAFRNTSFGTLRAVLEGLLREYKVRVVKSNTSCDVTLMIREDDPWIDNPCNINSNNCNSLNYANLSFGWINQCSPMVPQRWLVRGEFYQ